jgi:hypothetical protein
MPELQMMGPWQLGHERENMIELKEIIPLFSLYIIILLICTSLRLMEENVHLRKSVEKEEKKKLLETVFFGGSFLRGALSISKGKMVV